MKNFQSSICGFLGTRRIGWQLIDAATSVYANYRAPCRARSRAEFIAKIGVVTEESDECVGWVAGDLFETAKENRER